MASLVVLLALLLVATWTDLKYRAIYNRTVYPGIGAALLLNAVAEGLLWAGVEDAWLRRYIGFVGLGQSLIGFLLCGLLMVVCYVFFHVGGGDVKLIAMVGAFLGPYQGLEALLWTFVLGAAAGLMMLVCRIGPGRLLLRLGQQVLWMLRLRGRAPLSPEEHAELQTRLFLAPSALLSVVVVHWDLARLI